MVDKYFDGVESAYVSINANIKNRPKLKLYLKI